MTARNENSFIESLVDATVEGILVLDLDGKVRFANRTAAQLLGRGAEKGGDFGLDEYLEGETSAADFASSLFEELETNHHVVRMVRLRRDGEKGLHVLLTATRMVVDDRKLVVLTTRDVAELRRICDNVEEWRYRFTENLEQANIAALFLDPTSFEILRANIHAQALLDGGGLEGRKMPDLLDADSRKEARKVFRRIVRDRRGRKAEWTFLGKDGRQFVGEAHAGLITIGDRGMLQITVTDVTARHLLEEEVREARDFLEDLIRSSHLAIITYDRDLRPKSWNPEAEKMFGLEDDPFLTASDKTERLSILPPEFYIRAREIISEEAKRKGDQPLMFERIHSEGRPVSVESILSPIRNAEGGTIGLVEFARDISESVELEREAQYLRELTRQIVENIPSGIAVFAPTLTFRLVNRAFCDMLGVERETLIGRLIDEATIPTGIAEDFAHAARDVLRRGQRSVSEVRRVAVPSGELIVRYAALPLIDEEGEETLILGIFEDITDEETLQLQLIQSDKLAALGHLAAGIAHEIRSPLAAIYNSIYDLNELVDRSQPNIAEDIDISMEEVSRVQGIINSLLDFARSGREQPLAVDLNEMIARTLRLMSKSLSNQQIKITQKLGTAPMRITFSENAIKQVLLNLMTNAMHAMPDGGTLTVRTRLTADGSSVELDVEDDGDGMPPEVVKNIFNPFFTTKEPGWGTGLGLSVVHSTVTRHGGRIRVKTREGVGSCFTLVFPVVEQSDGERSDGGNNATAVVEVNDEEVQVDSEERIPLLDKPVTPTQLPRIDPADGTDREEHE